MRTFSKATLRRFWFRHPSSEAPLVLWYRMTEGAEWKNFGELRNDFPAADLVGRNVIFNIGGNSFRLIANVDYRYQSVFIRWVGTHAEYDRLTEKEIKNL